MKKNSMNSSNLKQNIRCKNHHFQWHKGKLKCVRCGHRKWLTNGTKGNIRRACIFGVFVVLGLFAYHQYAGVITNYVQIEKFQNIITALGKSFEAKPTNMTLIAFNIHNLINEQRKTNGLVPLSWNLKLSQAGLNHSNDMAKRNYFEHDTPEGQTFSDRYSLVGFNCQIPTSQFEYSGGGENIMFLQGYYGEDAIASETVTGWMNSSGHRANILTPYFQSEGIGVAESDDGKIYTTEDFC